MIARIASVVLVGALALLAFWQQREAPVAADDVVSALPPAVTFRAVRGSATPPFAGRWTLTFAEPPSEEQTLDLHIGVPNGTTAPGRITAEPGEAAALLARVAIVFAAGQDAATVQVPPATGLDLTLDLLGDKLSAGQGEVGAVVIAGGFVAEPAGDWRVYRATFGPGGPSCFLAISGADRTAVLLPRAVEDGPAILARVRALLTRHPPTS